MKGSNKPAPEKKSWLENLKVSSKNIFSSRKNNTEETVPLNANTPTASLFKEDEFEVFESSPIIQNNYELTSRPSTILVRPRKRSSSTGDLFALMASQDLDKVEMEFKKPNTVTTKKIIPKSEKKLEISECKILLIGVPGCGKNQIMDLLRSFVTHKFQEGQQKSAIWESWKTLVRIFSNTSYLKSKITNRFKTVREQSAPLLQVVDDSAIDYRGHVRSEFEVAGQPELVPASGVPTKHAFAKASNVSKQDEEIGNSNAMEPLEGTNKKIIGTTKISVTKKDEPSGIQDIIKLKHNNFLLKILSVNSNYGQNTVWLPEFDNSLALFYICPISQYDEYYRDGDKKRNYVYDSINIFKEISTQTQFSKLPIVVLFNKVDEFKKKVVDGVDLSTIFPKYIGGRDADNAIKYLKRRFKKRNTNKDRTLLFFLINDFEAKCIQTIFEGVRAVVIDRNLRDSNLFL